MTSDDVIEALQELGIETKEQFKAFLAPAVVAAALRKKEAALEKARADYETAKQSTAAAHAAAITEIEGQIAALKAQLNG